MVNSRVSYAYVAALLGAVFSIVYINGLQVFNYADGGFLWYGSWRTYLGEVPTLDFKSYDPGRYYWVSAFFDVLGDYNLSSLKLAIYTFFLTGVATLLLFLVGTVDRIRLAILALLLTVWAFPEHKLFDISISIISVVVMAQCLYRVNSNKWLVVGIWLGLAAFLGRNHVLYMSLATMATLALLWFAEVRDNLLSVLMKLTLGVALGLLPFVILVVSNNGFIENYWINKIIAIATRESANLRLPYPRFADMFAVFDNPSLSKLRQSFFVLTAYTYPLALVFILLVKIRDRFRKAVFSKLDATILSSAMLGGIYFHHFYSRADFPHLAQSITPLLIVLVLCATPRVIALIMLVSGILLSGYQGLPRYLLNPERYVSLTLVGEERLLNRSNRPLIDVVDYVKIHAENEDVIYAVPNIPAFYVLAGKRSPSYNSYDIFRMSEAFQRDLVAKMEQIDLCWVIFNDYAYDRQEKNRFSHTNRITYDVLIKDSERLAKFGPYVVLEPRICKRD